MCARHAGFSKYHNYFIYGCRLFLAFHFIAGRIHASFLAICYYELQSRHFKASTIITRPFAAIDYNYEMLFTNTPAITRLPLGAISGIIYSLSLSRRAMPTPFTLKMAFCLY